jgi:hypothetical protein
MTSGLVQGVERHLLTDSRIDHVSGDDEADRVAVGLRTASAAFCVAADGVGKSTSGGVNVPHPATVADRTAASTS